MCSRCKRQAYKATDLFRLANGHLVGIKCCYPNVPNKTLDNGMPLTDWRLKNE